MTKNWHFQVRKIIIASGITCLLMEELTSLIIIIQQINGTVPTIALVTLAKMKLASSCPVSSNLFLASL